MNQHSFKWKNVLNTAVIVAALGYFVDVYDLVLFLIVGKQSLLDIGVPKETLIENFQYLLNVQMIGMLVGGLFWGILADKKGRLSVLFGSIVMYSLANIANGFVNSLDMYIVLRFIAGFGLAGELGAGITLVSEIMSKETRGYGTMVVASVGVVGAVVAAVIARNFGWEVSYFIGGGLGISLLALRIGVFESGIFKGMEDKKVKQGNFFSLFNERKKLVKYLSCILIGLPVWFVIGILIGRAPEIAGKLNVTEKIDQGMCVMLCYSGLVFGDIMSGALSQFLRSRKKVFYFFYALCASLVFVYLNLYEVSATVFYTLIACLGFSVGFWAMFVTIASEQFGTNLRGTVTTTVPNFVRGSLVPVSIFFDYMSRQFGLVHAGMMVTVLIMAISFLALTLLEETFGKDLDYFEIN